jgi:hypothetical protein
MFGNDLSPTLVALHFHQLSEKGAVEEHRIAPQAPMGGNDDGRMGLLVAFDELGYDLRRDAWLVGQNEENSVDLRLHGRESRLHGAAQPRPPLLVDYDLDQPVGDTLTYLCRPVTQYDDHLLDGRV